jgi:phosphate ABC transporter phosphate-binding protein
MIGEHKTSSVSREQLLQNLKDSGLLPADDLQRLLASLAETGETDGQALARQLVSGGKLTAYQASAVLERRFTDLRIGAYDLLDLLGKGGMGTVYKGRHRRMKRLAAIKVLAPEVARQSTFAQRFQREVEVLAQLSHVNIVLAFDAGESDAGPFLAMEFVQGRDLASEVKEGGPLSVADALHCVLQAARGLEYAHAQGLIHRDVKPANLMRDTSGLVKVADLGLARIKSPGVTENESALTQAGGILGTVDYMAPEQALDSTAVDHRADIYSLGCTLFYLLTGRALYSGASLMSLLVQHREAPPPSLLDARPEAPAILNAIFQRMVAKWPEARYPTMTEVVAALEEARQTLPEPGLPALASRPATQAGSSASEITIAFPSPRQRTDHGLEPSARAATLAPGTAASATLVAGSGLSPAPEAPSAPAPAQPSSAGEGVGPAILPGATPGSHRRLLLAAAAVAGLLAGGGLLWWQARRPPAKEVETAQPKPAEPPARPAPFVGVILNGGGSTFVNPLMQHWAGIYEKRQGVRIDYQSVGSGRGSEGLRNRVFQFGCSDAPLTDQQLARVKQAGGEVLHIPLVLGAVVPAYNLPGVSAQLRFTGSILADIYLGKIVNWNDPALRIANPGIALPNRAITPVHRDDPSGTTFIWTDYLSKVSGEWQTRIGAATLVKWPAGLQGKGNNGVANQVSRNVGALGYLELTYALENNLRFGQVKNREGKSIAPSLESVTAAAAALTSIPADLRFSLTDAAGEDAYPIVGTTYALLHADQTGNPSGRDLVAFLRWATHEGQAYAKDLRYAPLPPEIVQRSDTALATVRLAAK